jgi:tetratricopeptide (TPR) repeat protein
MAARSWIRRVDSAPDDLLPPAPRLQRLDLPTAYALHQAGRYADAARVYQALLERDPDDPAALHLFGALHQQCGHSARAIELIGRAIALRPEVADFHANLAEAQRALGQHEQAVASCRAALCLRPDYPEALNNLGLTLHELGRHDEAISQFEAALALQPDFALAQNNRATALRALGQTSEAVEAYRAALALDPTLGQAHANLGQLLADQSQLVEGLAHCREAVRHQPDLAAGHNNLGNVLRALARWAEAEAAYAEALRLQPDLGVAHANLGLALQQQGKPGAALPHFRRAADLAREDAAVCQQLAEAHALAEDWAEALPWCQRRVELQPHDADAHNALGWAYQSDGRPAEAEAAYRRALELQPDHLDARLNLGSLHEELGALSEAEACYREAEARQLRSPLPLARRAVLTRGRLSEGDRDRLRFALYRPHGPLIRLNLLFALAQVADARGEHAEAAACLEPANAVARALRRSRGQTYDADEHARYVDRLIAAFTPALFARLAGAGDASVRPVFVFGLPRSGTTLVEQVLASHSQVFGAGELPLARRAMDAVPAAVDRPQDQDMTACLEALDGAALGKLASGYQDGVDALLARGTALQPRGTALPSRPAQQDGSGEPSYGGPALPSSPARVVDKMPDNYLYLGLLALLFPRATLIHVRRDVRDVAVSCWLTHFRGIRWADDPARRIRDYQRLTAHWQAVLPRPVVEVSYERLVDNFATEARRLVEACGLAWEPACLRFHETARPVRTASVAQVRQPLYRKALGRWKAYEPYLGPLFERLQDRP